MKFVTGLIAHCFLALVKAADVYYTNLQSCVSSYDAEIDYFAEKVEVEKSSKFTVTYRNNYKEVRNLFTNEQIVLYQCGTPKPNLTEENVKYFPVPMTDVAVGDTTITTFFELLGLRQEIKALASADYAISPCLQKMTADNGLINLKWDQSGNTTYLSQDAGLNMVFDGYSASSGFNPFRVTVSASADETPLARAEWIKYVALFFNKEGEANKYFQKLATQYQCVSRNAKNANNQKRVLWVNYFPDNTYFSQSAQWILDKASFKTSFVADSAGVNPNIETKSIFTTSTEFLAALKDLNVDVIIDLSWIKNPEIDPYDHFLQVYGLKSMSDKELNANFKFIATKNVWRTDVTRNGNNAETWFENAIAMPDGVLRDLESILETGKTYDDSFHWFRNAAKQDKVTIVGSTGCDGINKPLKYSAEYKCEIIVHQTLIPVKEEALGSAQFVAIALGSVCFIVVVVALVLYLSRGPARPADKPKMASV
jgi:hypothetical protein